MRKPCASEAARLLPGTPPVPVSTELQELVLDRLISTEATSASGHNWRNDVIAALNGDQALSAALRGVAQSESEATVEGLARLLHETSTRRDKSQVEIRQTADPVTFYIEDARAVALTKELPAEVAARVVPGFCRAAVEAACMEAIRRRRLGRGEPHDEVEQLLARNTKTNPLLALALFDDEQKGSEVLSTLRNKFSAEAVETFWGLPLRHTRARRRWWMRVMASSTRSSISARLALLLYSACMEQRRHKLARLMETTFSKARHRRKSVGTRWSVPLRVFTVGRCSAINWPSSSRLPPPERALKRVNEVPLSTIEECRLASSGLYSRTRTLHCLHRSDCARRRSLGCRIVRYDHRQNFRATQLLVRRLSKLMSLVYPSGEAFAYIKYGTN